MAMRTPPSWLQNGSHPAENDRLSMQAIFSTTGIVGASSLAVTAQGTPNMTVNVASGWAAIVGTTQSNMGTYIGYNDATTILTVTTANAVNPRIDLVCMTVNDAYYSGSTNNVVLQIIAGTAAASPVAPTLPANSVSLATIAVAANATTITSGNITDTRVQTTTNLFSSSGYVTLTGTQTLTNKTLTSPVVTTPAITGGTVAGATLGTAQTFENAFLTSTAFSTGGYQFYTTTNGAVQYITANSTGAGTLNITSASGVTLNSIMATNSAVTVVFALTQTTTGYLPSAYQIDGSAVTPKWAGGTAPTASASAIDVLTLTIIKTASATFTVLASATKFA